MRQVKKWRQRWQKDIRYGLKQQVLLGAVLLVLLPILMVSVWINYRVSTNLRAEAGQEEKKITSDVSNSLDKFLTTSEDSLQAATLLPGWQDAGLRQKNLKALEELPVGWSRVEYQDRATGKVWSAGSNLPSNTALPLSVQAAQTTQDRVTSVQISTLDDPQKQGIEWLVFAVPLPSTAQTAGGVLKTYFPLQTLKNELRGSLSLPSTTRVWLADDRGRFVLDSKNDAQGSKSLTPAFLAELGQANLVSESKLPQWGWQVVVAQDRAATLADARRMTWEIAGIAGVMLLVTLILAIFYSAQQLKREQTLQLHRKIFEESSEGMLVTDVEARILRVNRAFTQMTGYEEAEVRGQNPRFLQSERQGQDFYQQLWSELLLKGRWSGDIWNKRKSGEVYPSWLEVSAVSDSEGDVCHYAALFRDRSEEIRLLTELRLAGKLQRKMLRDPFQHEAFQAQILFYPSGIVSGDYADYRWFPRANYFSGCLFDVMGHGMIAGTLVSGLRVLYRQVIERELSVDQQLSWLNQECRRLLPEDMFTAALLFEFSPSTGDFSWSTAGITKFLTCCGGKVSWQTSEGLFLGIVSTAHYEEGKLSLKPGDWIALLSDGFTDVLEELERSEDFIWSDQVPVLAGLLQRLTEEGQVRDDATALLLSYGDN